MTPPHKKNLLPTLPGFEHINRYIDKHMGCVAAKILPGEYYVTRHDECVTTVLGSCVSACIRDVRTGIGGMNHFMLPLKRDNINDAIISDAARYGNFAMEHLINDIMKYGGSRNNLEFKVFGGGKIMQNMMGIGEKNIQFVLEYLKTEGFTAKISDLGDIYPRKIIYFPKSGRALMKKLKSMHNNTIIERESRYIDQLKEEPIKGDIELF